MYSVHLLKLDLRVEYGSMLHSSECVNGVFCRPEARFGLSISIEVSVPARIVSGRVFVSFCSLIDKLSNNIRFG